MNTPSQKSDQRISEGPYRVHFYEKCNHSPASCLVPQAISEIKRKGSPTGHPLCRFTRSAAWQLSVKTARQWPCSPTSASGRKSRSATRPPDHRRKGTHNVLFNALVDRATKQGNIVSIDSRTHANNLAAQAAFEAQGRTKEYITYTYPLKDRRDGKGPTDEEMRMPEYSSSPSRPRRPQEHAGLHKREKAAEGYALHQAVPESKYRWVLIFSSLSSAQRPAT